MILWPYAVRRAIAIARGHQRLFASIAAGALSFPVFSSWFAGGTAGILAWDFGSLVFLALAAILFSGERLSRIAQDAASQMEGEWTIFWITLAAVIASFAAIIYEFAGIREVSHQHRNWHVVLVAGTLVVSWLLSHTLFAMRYAHEFYERSPGAATWDGGLVFPQEDRPDYWDFLYFALVLGMTFQVSDVQITSRKLRRLATLHGLLSFFYNATIIALTVNLAAGLL